MKSPAYIVSAFAGLVAWGSIAMAEPEENGAFDGAFWHLYAAGSVIHLNNEGNPYRFGLGLGYPVLGNRVFLVGDLVYSYYEVNAVADEHPEPEVKGGASSSLGADFSLRYEVLQVKRITCFAEGGIGFQSMLGSPTFPADGSHQNFTLFGGPGILISCGERFRLGVALRWFHISNAWLFSSNSGYDGVQLVLTPEWSW